MPERVIQEYETVKCIADDKSHIATVTLNRPHKRNAISEKMQAELESAFSEIGRDSRIRCVVLKAAGPTFCAGHDMTETPTHEPFALSGEFFLEQRHVLARMAAWRRTLGEIPQPVIGQVHGQAFTVGVHIAMNCDLLYVAKDAQFVVNPPTVIGGAGYFADLYPWLAGLRRAKELVFTRRAISGLEAAEIGLANRAVEAAELDDLVAAMASKVAAGALAFHALNKQAFQAIFESSGGRFGLEYTATIHALSHLTDEAHDAKEGNSWAAYRH